jgi:hypothetical protein
VIKIQFNIGSGERVARELSLLVAITLALGFAGAFIFVSAGELGNLRLRRTFETFGIFLMVSATSSLIYQVIFKPQMDKRFLDKMQSAFQSRTGQITKRNLFWTGVHTKEN